MSNEVKEPIASYGKLYSYADYLTWKTDERIELIKGKIFKMSPAPARVHQDVLLNLTEHFIPFFKPFKCKVYVAPFDVRLLDSKKSTADNDIHTVVQPDLCVICDLQKLDKRGCLGAPDLVVEIISPGNSKKELKHKFELYEENDVKEYWLVDYVAKTILIYVLQDGKYIGLKPLIEEETITSRLFPDMNFVVGTIFED